MRDKALNEKMVRIWRSFVLILFAGFIGGSLWAVNRYVPPQHLFWKNLDTNRPLGLATKQQLFALNFKPSKSCVTLVENTIGFKTTAAASQRPVSGVGKNICGWDVARNVHGAEAVKFSPNETQMQCPLSVAVFLWQREVDALAKKHFGQPLAKIHHYGSYSCRKQRGNGSGSWSEHAFANAWDVASFELEDGSRIQILKDWDGERKKANFLREARQAACGIFRVTLSPDFNAAHADHFHLDMGPSKSCK